MHQDAYIRRAKSGSLLVIISMIAACSTGGSDQNAAYGGNTVKPYTEADVAYGRKLQAKIDAARDASRDVAISKSALDPFRVVGDLYFVGVHNFGVYVVKTPAGVIMLDAGWDDTADKTEASLKKIGIDVKDIKIMLMTEMHGDHNSAAAYFKEKSGAKLYVMEGDVEGVEKGATGGIGEGEVRVRPVKVDRVLRDRDQVTLGGKTLTAIHVPGHTKGSTTWYWQETENGQTYNVADVCCWFVPANVVSDPNFSTAQLRRNWEVLKSLPVDIPAPGIHTYHFDTLGKLARIKAGEDRLQVMIDPQGYRGVIAAFERDFEDKVKQQLRDGPSALRALAPAGQNGAVPAAPRPQ